MIEIRFFYCLLVVLRFMICKFVFFREDLLDEVCFKRRFSLFFLIFFLEIMGIIKIWKVNYFLIVWILFYKFGRCN